MSKIDLFIEQDIEKQRQILAGMLEVFKGKSSVLEKTLEIVMNATTSLTLINIMKSILSIADHIDQKRKEQDIQKIEKNHEVLKNLKAKELAMLEEDLESLLQSQLDQVE